MLKFIKYFQKGGLKIGKYRIFKKGRGLNIYGSK